MIFCKNAVIEGVDPNTIKFSGVAYNALVNFKIPLIVVINLLDSAQFEFIKRTDFKTLILKSEEIVLIIDTYAGRILDIKSKILINRPKPILITLGYIPNTNEDPLLIEFESLNNTKKIRG